LFSELSMLVNLIDHRDNAYNTRVDVVLEPAWQDNRVAGATPHARNEALPPAQERFQLTLSEAIAWAHAQEGEFTLFIYTKNSNLSPLRLQ
jgi:hypothetical protein